MTTTGICGCLVTLSLKILKICVLLSSGFSSWTLLPFPSVLRWNLSSVYVSCVRYLVTLLLEWFTSSSFLLYILPPLTRSQGNLSYPRPCDIGTFSIHSNKSLFSTTCSTFLPLLTLRKKSRYDVIDWSYSYLVNRVSSVFLWPCFVVCTVLPPESTSCRSGLTLRCPLSIFTSWSKFDGRVMPSSWPNFAYAGVRAVLNTLSTFAMGCVPSFDLGSIWRGCLLVDGALTLTLFLCLPKVAPTVIFSPSIRFIEQRN